MDTGRVGSSGPIRSTLQLQCSMVCNTFCAQPDVLLVLPPGLHRCKLGHQVLPSGSNVGSDDGQRYYSLRLEKATCLGPACMVDHLHARLKWPGSAAGRLVWYDAPLPLFQLALVHPFCHPVSPVAELPVQVARHDAHT